MLTLFRPEGQIMSTTLLFVPLLIFRPSYGPDFMVLCSLFFFYRVFKLDMLYFKHLLGRQKLDVILGIKVVQFWSYQKIYFTKNVALNWYSSMNFFFRKIRTFFDIEKWLWKSDLGTFWRPVWTSVKVKSKKYFYFTDFFTKMKPLLTHVNKTPPLRSHYCVCIPFQSDA